MANYNLQWFEILTKGRGYVIYGTGAWEGHIMDWAGMNFHHGRIKIDGVKSPHFKTIKDAIIWLDKQIKVGKIFEKMEQSGHHSGEYECSKGCNDRVVSGFDTLWFPGVAMHKKDIDDGKFVEPKHPGMWYDEEDE